MRASPAMVRAAAAASFALSNTTRASSAARCAWVSRSLSGCAGSAAAGVGTAGVAVCGTGAFDGAGVDGAGATGTGFGNGVGVATGGALACICTPLGFRNQNVTAAIATTTTSASDLVGKRLGCGG